MIYGSVCSGIEAATVAWHPLGWKPAFFSEIEPFPRAILDHHYPEVPLHGDFTTIKTNQYRPIDLLVGGTPCQSFSIAGLRGGMDDSRGNLALEFLKLAKLLRPRWVVWENVPGVLSSNGGWDFGSILAGLGEIGYGFAYRVLDAQYFGLAQRRKRVFVVGYLGDWRPAAAVLFERESLHGNPAPSREQGKKIAPTLNVRAGPDGDTFHTSGGLVEHISEIAPTLNAKFGEKQGLDNQHIDGGGDCLLPPIAMCLNAGAMGRQDSESETLILTNRCGEGEAQAYSIMPMNSGRDYKARPVDVSQPIMAAKSGGNQGGDVVVNASAVRRLTPRECERLQGFSDDFTAIPWRNKPADQCPDGPRYKALGNSMAVPVMRWIGERIQKVEKKTKRTIT
jgi:DNA (cytosine-5)-methyltransferase 1